MYHKTATSSEELEIRIDNYVSTNEDEEISLSSNFEQN